MSNVTINAPCAYYPPKKKYTLWEIQEIYGKEYLVIDDTQFKIPLDWAPDSNTFVTFIPKPEGVGDFPVVFGIDDNPVVLYDEGYNLNED